MISWHYICLSVIGILLSGFIVGTFNEIVTKSNPNINNIYNAYPESLLNVSVAVGVTCTVCLMIGITLAFYKGTLVIYSEGSTLLQVIDKTMKNPPSDMEEISNSAKEIPYISSKILPLKSQRSSLGSIEVDVKLLQQMQERILAVEKRTVEVEEQTNNLADSLISQENHLDLTDMPPPPPPPPKRNPPRGRGRSLSNAR